MGRAVKQGLKLKRTQRELWRFLGVRRAKDHGRAVVWALAVCIVMVTLFWAAGYAAVQYRHGRQNEAAQEGALVLADTQLTALRAAAGLALGRQCFDSRGAPESDTDPGAPCSYYPNTMASGCLSYTGLRCYAVHIISMHSRGTAANRQAAVTYRVEVTWGVASKVSVAYRLMQANAAYQINLIHTPAMDGPVNGTNTSLTQITSTGKAITRLSDISGGPGISISTPECMPGEPCYGAAGKYNLTGVFTVVTNIPSQLITACTWDFGDGSAPAEVQAAKSGCDNGQTMVHEYRNAWQLQNLPPFPESCFAPLGSGVDTHGFLVRVTLHTTEGVDVTSKAPLQLIMPGCA